MIVERFRKAMDTHTQLRQHFVCSRDAYTRLSYFAHTLATDTASHTRRRKTDSVLQTCSCIFIPDHKHFPSELLSLVSCSKIISNLQAKR